jgi:hypothetical protein
MSNFWVTIPQGDDKKEEGIINKDKLPFKVEYFNIQLNNNITVNIFMNEEIKQDVLMFISNNGLSPSGNSYILNPKSVLGRVTSKVVTINKLGEKILGFALSIPHSIKFNNQIIDTSLTTNLCVSLKHRNMNIAKLLISSIIDYGYNNQIYTGYHYISEPKNSSNIQVKNFFRPLNVDLAKECGYQIPQKDYILNNSSDYKIRKSELKDFDICDMLNKKITISMNERSFVDHLRDSECLTVIYKSKIIGVCIYKTILLKIAKTNKICPVARLVFFDCVEDHTVHAMTQVINYLIEGKRHIVLSGVCLGNLTDEDVKKKLSMFVSGESYLDFYNLYINEENRNASKINLLYI